MSDELILSGGGTGRVLTLFDSKSRCPMCGEDKPSNEIVMFYAADGTKRTDPACYDCIVEAINERARSMTVEPDAVVVS